MKIEKNDIILFNGDSITDNSRDRNDEYSLSGYNKMVATTLQTFYSDLNLTFYNRGVSGDTSSLLLNRLENEIIEIKPTIFSLLIGINDTWRRFDANNETTTSQFDKNISQIMKIISKYVKKIIIIEPFILNTDAEKSIFREDLNPKIQVLRKYAELYKTDYIPMDGVFAELQVKNGAKYYSEDGVHPTVLGHTKIAKEWINRAEF